MYVMYAHTHRRAHIQKRKREHGRRKRYDFRDILKEKYKLSENREERFIPGEWTRVRP